MDGLELLKKDWKKQDESLPKFNTEELYSMIKQKSSSLVKWIFIISILEFVFWIGLEVLSVSMGYNDLINEAKLDKLYFAIMTINYIVILGFIALFFYNYRKITITDNAKLLMKKILVARKTVKCYVWFNIIYFAITFMVVSYFLVLNLEEIPNDDVWIFMGVMCGIMLVFIAIILLFYRLLYGILTRKLYKNYKELQRLDLQ